MATADDKAAETARLKEVMAPVHTRLLQLLDAAGPSQRIFGRNIAKKYTEQFNLPLDPAQLTGQQDLRQMLGRRSLLPNIGIKGSGDQWYVYRLRTSTDSLEQLQTRILELIKGAEKPELVDGHGLQAMYGDKYKEKLECRAFGCKGLRELIDRCDKLKVRMKNDKMYIRCADGFHSAAPAPAPAKGAVSVREAKRAAKRARDGEDAVVVKRISKTKTAKATPAAKKA